MMKGFAGASSPTAPVSCAIAQKTPKETGSDTEDPAGQRALSGVFQ